MLISLKVWRAKLREKDGADGKLQKKVVRRRRRRRRRTALMTKCKRRCCCCCCCCCCCWWWWWRRRRRRGRGRGGERRRANIMYLALESDAPILRSRLVQVISCCFFAESKGWARLGFSDLVRSMVVRFSKFKVLLVAEGLADREKLNWT